MNRDLKPRQSAVSTRSGSRGNTLVGIFVGLIIGALVAMFVSPEEQRRRLAERLERPDKYWKYNPGDLDERTLWPAYQEAYQAVLDRTSTERAPWYIVPCDKKWYARLAVTELLIEALKGLDLSWPPPDFDVEAEKRKLASL